ncbi:helix-turn-helix transcriptional regulator [Amycolatopsis jiangsuensis]|uniref:DNA-binding CsgD family transcriptional regulator n=1 Tax=Amycolatopsis jiangsuensis TaxID=1181879 RepID=A0A840J4N3_9PSEU|nr:helix-turn-helix transcriptional regulator [Amycolatopsis jiangsuensis]MBB4688368.1 DNA-binding CsgD family transcriptional regulator [Amycolatopsis jiangsuensis]
MTLAFDQPRPLSGTPAVAVADLLSRASIEVLVMSTQSVHGPDPIGLVRPGDQDNLRRGVRYRVLAPDAARTAPRLATRLAALTLAGASTRTIPRVPLDALVVDGTAVVLPAGITGVAAFHLPGVVTSVVELFERVWPTAVPLQTAAEGADSDLRERELLKLLSAGYTDAAAAVKLGISVRTVRRTVADLMNRLGARSRFQAGAKAADRGWLNEQAS